MMTSINPKNVNTNNIQSNEVNIVPPTANSLFQRNNFGIEKQGINDGIGNNMKFKTNLNNYNLNFGNDNQNQLKNLPNLQNFKNPEKKNDNIMKKMNFDYTSSNKISNDLNNLNLNYNNQNNSINLNLGLQAKKNYSTPILNEAGPQMNQDKNYNKPLNIIDKNQEDNNKLNLNQPQKEGNNDFYLAEMEKLKSEINNLKKDNELLNNQLKEEQRKNAQLISMQKEKDENENSILSEISVCLQVSSFNEILPKLNEIINYLNNNVNNNNNTNKPNKENKIRDELISKLQSLYLSLTGSNEKKEEITIKILWRWIKHLINTVKQLALEKEKNIEIYQNNQEIEDYKEYCEELISDFNLQSLDELKMFIDNLLKQTNINIIKSNENENQQELRNIPMGAPGQMAQQQFQMQNYQHDEENEEGDIEQDPGEEGEGDGEGEGEGEGEEEMDDGQNQQHYVNENEYDENEMMQMMRNQQNMNMNMH